MVTSSAPVGRPGPGRRAGYRRGGRRGHRLRAHGGGRRQPGAGQVAGRPALPTSPTLQASARATSQEQCDLGRAKASTHPEVVYDRESAQAVHELVASARLDPKVGGAAARNAAATKEIRARWRTDPALTDPRWDTMGVGEVTGGSGRLDVTVVLADAPAMPATARYASIQHADDAVIHIPDLVCGTAVDSQGVTGPFLWTQLRLPG